MIELAVASLAMTNLKGFTQGEWHVGVFDNGYSFQGPEGFSAAYPGRAAERIDKGILDGPPYAGSWAAGVVWALPFDQHIPKNLVRDVNRYVRAHWEWED